MVGRTAGQEKRSGKAKKRGRRRVGAEDGAEEIGNKGTEASQGGSGQCARRKPELIAEAMVSLKRCTEKRGMGFSRASARNNVRDPRVNVVDADGAAVGAIGE
jgi:hypothetical protein